MCVAQEKVCPGGARCILKSWFCDGDVDCPDEWDESNCTTVRPQAGEHSVGIVCAILTRIGVTAANPVSVWGVNCSAGMWQCASRHECVPIVSVCDGVDTCRDASDESATICRQDRSRVVLASIK